VSPFGFLGFRLKPSHTKDGGRGRLVAAAASQLATATEAGYVCVSLSVWVVQGEGGERWREGTMTTRALGVGSS
jgi:hypothetical protein